MSKKQMSRDEKLKVKYAILRNITGDSTKSNKAKHWGYERIYKELNIWIPQYLKTGKAKLKAVSTFQRNRLLKSAENKYKYAIKKGITPENAEIVKYQTYKVIDLQLKYQMFFKAQHKRLSKREKDDRIDEWSDWSKEDVYPPILVKKARDINLSEGLDINDSYGFGIMFYNFTTNKSIENLMDQFKPDKATGMIIYKTVGGR